MNRARQSAFMRLKTRKANSRYVQSYICSVSFPETVEGVLQMVKGNKLRAAWATDVDTLLNFNDGDSIFWTAPKWITENDVVVFYQTRRALQRTERLLAIAKADYPRKRRLINLLERARRIAEFYSGKIFACASVAGATERLAGLKKHFISPHFAPLKEVYIFDEPLSQDAFADYVKIGRSTITPLYKREFVGVKTLLSARKALPDFLRDAVAGGDGFKDVNSKNWISISCAPDARFIHEAQLRAYFLDYFLNELKDKSSSVLEECECFRGAKNTGRADYFVRVFGQWIPVEAKLNIAGESGVLSQVAKYTNVDSFVPKKGVRRERVFKISKSLICLLVDKFGIYFVSSRNKFIKCSFRNPVWKREELAERTPDEMREAINAVFESVAVISRKKNKRSAEGENTNNYENASEV